MDKTKEGRNRIGLDEKSWVGLADNKPHGLNPSPDVMIPLVRQLFKAIESLMEMALLAGQITETRRGVHVSFFLKKAIKKGSDDVQLIKFLHKSTCKSNEEAECGKPSNWCVGVAKIKSGYLREAFCNKTRLVSINRAI